MRNGAARAAEGAAGVRGRRRRIRGCRGGAGAFRPGRRTGRRAGWRRGARGGRPRTVFVDARDGDDAAPGARGAGLRAPRTPAPRKAWPRGLPPSPAAACWWSRAARSTEGSTCAGAPWTCGSTARSRSACAPPRGGTAPGNAPRDVFAGARPDGGINIDATGRRAPPSRRSSDERCMRRVQKI